MTVILALLISVSVWAENPIRAQEKKPECEGCVRIEKFQDEADHNPQKAARSFAKFIGVFELSKTPKIRQQEMDELLKMAAQLIDKDERFEIQQYLWGYEKDDPKLYKASMEKLSASEQKLIKDEVAKVSSMMETGKEPEPKPGEE